MRFKALALIPLFAIALLAFCESADAGRPKRNDRWSLRFSRTQPWHAGYYHKAPGYPVPLVVPPTAQMQTSWGWGVSQSEMRNIYHQFRRPFPGYVEGGMGNLQQTPNWPSHTDQFGVYYIRGPW